MDPKTALIVGAGSGLSASLARLFGAWMRPERPQTTSPLDRTALGSAIHPGAPGGSGLRSCPVPKGQSPKK